ncbi:MAG: hypothetical protein J7K84_00185 [Deltaproteobacteria bacterium]|nr:hypothetical protein [Deltaproteobacteria bacterium]
MSPGGEGKIDIRVKTNGYGGRKLRKSIIVQTNDPKHKKITLVISGEVEKFVAVIPKRVTLRGISGTNIKRSVKIIPEKKYPFKITGSRTKKGDFIEYVLEKSKKPEEFFYILKIRNKRTTKGGYHDIIYLKTDSKIQPEIKISIYGTILDKPITSKTTGKNERD